MRRIAEHNHSILFYQQAKILPMEFDILIFPPNDQKQEKKIK